MNHPPRHPRPATGKHRSAGFTFIGVMIMVTIIGIASVASLQVGSILQRRAAEQELLDIGTEFRNALISFANASPAGQKRVPSSLQDLLKDPRYPNTVRHLRQIYIDPLTGKADWGLIHTLDGTGLVGVYSLCEGVPIKIANFDLSYQHFTGKSSYADWRFLTGMQAVGQTSTSSNPRNLQPLPDTGQNR